MRHRVDTDPRDHFVRIEGEIRAENDSYVFERDKLSRAFEAELLDECRNAGIRVPDPKHVERLLRVKHADLYEMAIAPYKVRAEELLARHNDRLAVLRERLHTMAKWSVIQRSPEGSPPVEFYSCHVSAFSTQTAPSAYAEAAATARLWTVGYVDPQLRCQVEVEGEEYKLYVNLASDLDKRILYVRCYNEGVPVGEFVRRCWSCTWNPRVLDPFLPTGLEDKLGLDYMGHDKRAVLYHCERCGMIYHVGDNGIPCNVRPEESMLIKVTVNMVLTRCQCGFDLRPKHANPSA